MLITLLLSTLEPSCETAVSCRWAHQSKKTFHQLIEAMLGLLAANNIIAGSICSYSYNTPIITLLLVSYMLSGTT